MEYIRRDLKIIGDKPPQGLPPINSIQSSSQSDSNPYKAFGTPIVYIDPSHMIESCVL
jgi:hypothetical protein